MVMVWVIAGILQKQYLVSILNMGQRQEMDNNSVKDFKMYLRFLFYEAHTGILLLGRGMGKTQNVLKLQ